ncbi:EpsG family protein [Amorphus sp. 3PC139-8]
MSLFLFTAFRFEVGCDWSGYLNQWNNQEYSSFDLALTKTEPVWWAAMDALQAAGLSYPWLNVFSSALFFLGVHAAARRQPDRLGFLVLLFPILIINMPMSGIRQGAAVGVLLFAFNAFVDRRLVRFVVLVLLSSTVHNSAIIFLLLTPLVRGEFTKRRLLAAGLLAIPGAVALLSGSAAEQATDRYIDSGVDAAGSAFRVGLLCITGAFYFRVLEKKWRVVFPRDHKLVSVGALIMCALVVLVPLSTVIADRLGYYLIPIQTMIFARIPYLPVGKNRKFYSAAPYLGLALVFIVWVSLSQLFYGCYVPYQTWIFGWPDVTRYLY